MRLSLSLLSLTLVAASCASSTPDSIRSVEIDPAIRAPMMEAISSLEGRWVSTTPFGEGVHEFKVSSAGSAVREIMSPGTEHEMTNMYTLDGNAMTMTHYCSAGNQPRMRAVSFDGTSLAFESAGVTDLKNPDDVYMGAMTLVFVDDDHVEQHWTSITGDVIDEMGAFTLRRQK